MDLLKIRDEIDVVDREIVRLFEKRMELCKDVADYKISVGKEVFDAKREKEKLQTLRQQATGSFNKKGVEELFQQIMSMSRKLQYQCLTEHGVQEPKTYHMVDRLPVENANVVFQGVEGAYSYAAMKEYFKGEVSSFHVDTWREAMDAIAEGRADYGVLPIENSTAGIVSDIYDLLAEYDLYVVGEQVIKCEHVLLGVPGSSMEDIREVYSHPQALMQCMVFLREHPDWVQREWGNTAGAAKKIAQEGDRSQAAIASRAAAEFFGLEILQEGIYHNAQNSTRFIIVSKCQTYEKGANKISICLEIPHESGSLYSMLSHIIYNGLNMTKIESRPIAERNWEYRFFIDFEGNLEESAVKNALRGIVQEASALRIIGNY